MTVAALLALGLLIVVVVVIIVVRSRPRPTDTEGATARLPPLLDGADAEPVTKLTLGVEGDQPFLRKVSGPSSSKEKFFIPGSGRATIGRAPDNDIVITEEAASSRHCRLERQEGAYVLSDLGSTNGTWVNGVQKSLVVLRNGDQIRVGATTLVFAMFGDRDNSPGVVVARTAQ